MNRRLILALAAGGLLPTFARAQAPATTAPAVTVRDAWSRATPPHAATGAAYMTLTSPAGDRLTGVSSPAAASAGVHEMRMDGAVMRMRPVEGGLELPAGEPVTLAPGGYHVMLEGLKAPLKQGHPLTLHLTFQHAPPLDVAATVRPIGASGPGTAPMPGMGMGK